MWSTSAANGNGSTDYVKMATDAGKRFFKSRRNSNPNSIPTSNQNSLSSRRSSSIMKRLPSLAKLAMGK